MARDSLDMSGSDTESESMLDSIPDGSVRLASTFSGPTAFLAWRPNSHKFDDRVIPLTEPVKVGRSVAKLKPAPHNAIFDCKVLSRNHALLWYENGKFLVKDTQSSNGTFVNSDRLSTGSEESPPREIFSGDILQFGVDVIENSKKVTHGCVIALARLFHPNGTEAKPPPCVAGDAFSSLTCGQRQSLVQVVMDATQREEAVRDKVQSLQVVIEQLMRAAEQSWKAMIDEERLLNKIETLETKLAAVGENNQTAEVSKLIQAKETYEGLAKESLSTILQEKLMALRKCDELQYLQKITNEQVSQLQTSNDALKGQLSELADKCDSMRQETESLLEGHVREKKDLETKLAQQREEMTKMQDTICSLQAELVGAKQQARQKAESPVSEKGLTIEDAASETEDKISLDSFQGETKSSKDEIVRLEETLQQLKAKLAKIETEKVELQSELAEQKKLVDARTAELGSKIELQVQLDLLKWENGKLETELAEYKLKAKQLEDLAKENDELKTRNLTKLDSPTSDQAEHLEMKSSSSSSSAVSAGSDSEMAMFSAALEASTTATTSSAEADPRGTPTTPYPAELEVTGVAVSRTTPCAASATTAEAEMAKEIRRLQAELCCLKQNYARCLEEKVEMRQEFDDMAKEYGGVARQLSTVCRSAVVPLVVLCAAMFMISQPFHSVFGSSKS